MKNKVPANSEILIGREYPPADEIGYITKMISQLKEELRHHYQEGETLRQAHPKMHGLVKARFIIEKDLDSKLQKGVFAKPTEYGAFIRFSNAAGTIAPDKKKDIRGMAIKLVGVEGEKLLSDKQDAKTQDFILISTETFISKHVKEFSGLVKAIASRSKLAIIFYLLTHWGVLFRTLKAFKSYGSLADIPFYSTTPYQFGDVNGAVKYACIPVNPENPPIPSKPDNDYLRYQLTDMLSRREVIFNFCIQFQKDAKEMPIENATVKWDSEFIKVATIVIPMQQFDNDAQIEFGNNLSFNPWNSLPDHRPLGGLNRARRLIYENLTKFRHKQNDQVESEPTDLNIPSPI